VQFIIKLAIAIVSSGPSEGPRCFVVGLTCCVCGVARTHSAITQPHSTPPSAPRYRDHHYHAHSVQCAAGPGDLAACRAVSTPIRRGRRRTDRRRPLGLHAQAYMAPHIKVQYGAIVHQSPEIYAEMNLTCLSHRPCPARLSGSQPSSAATVAQLERRTIHLIHSLAFVDLCGVVWYLSGLGSWSAGDSLVKPR
jgi:hypothetical protein